MQKINWELIGAQFALLPAFEGLIVSLERKRLQDEPKTLHARLRSRLPADIPLDFEARNILSYNSPAHMAPPVFREYLRRNTVPEAKASADSTVRSSSEVLQDTPLMSLHSESLRKSVHAWQLGVVIMFQIQSGHDFISDIYMQRFLTHSCRDLPRLTISRE